MTRIKLILLTVILYNNKLIGQDSIVNISYKDYYLNHVYYNGFNLFFENSVFEKLEFDDINYNFFNNKLSFKNYFDITFSTDSYTIVLLDTTHQKQIPKKVYYLDTFNIGNNFNLKTMSYSYHYTTQNILNEAIINLNKTTTKMFFNKNGIESLLIIDSVSSNKCIINFIKVNENSKVIFEVLMHNFKDSNYLSIYNRINTNKNYVKEVFGFDISSKKSKLDCYILFNKKGVLKRRFRSKS